MLVGFDISQTAHGGGVATYTNNLAKNLISIPDLEMVFFYSSLRKPYKGGLKNVKVFRLPPTLFEVLFNRIRNTNIEKFLGEIDVFHSSDWVQPPTKAKKVTTYHDVIPIKYPKWSHPKIVSVHKRRLEIIKKEVDIIIAVSQSTKDDLIEVSGIAPNKIVVIYEAAADDFKVENSSRVDEFKSKYNLPDKFVLSIGGVGERRNLENVKKAAKKHSLVITGESLPWITPQEMSLLYNSATLLLYPSFYEGFGLPILEAFACGLPVITSNVSSMPEVAGEAALYVDPNDISDIEKKVNSVMEDVDLRRTLQQKGFKQNEKFSWKKTAQLTAEVYQQAVSELRSSAYKKVLQT